MTPLPLGADWLTFELLHVHALYSAGSADPVVKIVASIDAVPCPTLETKSLQMLNSVHKSTSTETAQTPTM